jgi:hypothetical protein
MARPGGEREEGGSREDKEWEERFLTSTDFTTEKWGGNSCGQ